MAGSVTAVADGVCANAGVDSANPTINNVWLQSFIISSPSGARAAGPMRFSVIHNYNTKPQCRRSDENAPVYSCFRREPRTALRHVVTVLEERPTTTSTEWPDLRGRDAGDVCRRHRDRCRQGPADEPGSGIADGLPGGHGNDCRTACL